MISLALISPMKNLLLVMEQLKETQLRVEYEIYGGIKDEEYWNKCKEVAEVFPFNVKFEYEGAAQPDEVEHVLAGAHIFVLPSKSENFGHAILEALSAGRPVITSFGTPYRNLLEKKAGLNIHPENSSELAAALQFFGEMDESELKDWSAGARRYAEEFVKHLRLEEAYSTLFEVKNQAVAIDK